MEPAVPPSISVLLVEADPLGGDRIRRLLDEAPGLDGVEVGLRQARSLDSAIEILSGGGVDVVLLDPFLPDSRGMTTFERASAFAPDVPFLIYAETADDRLAVGAVQEGAQDVLIKGEVRPSDLGRALVYAIERHRLLAALRSLSLIDDLTGLYNRRGFSELGEQYVKLAWRSGRAITLVYLDVDRFKNINDSLGHQMGDQALRQIADTLRATFRRSDVLARLGGDEFAVLALETTGEPAEWLVQRLREGVAASNLASREPYHLTASVGVARAVPDGRLDLRDLLAQADAAMYREKRSKQRAAYL